MLEVIEMLYRPTVRGMVLLLLASSSTLGCFAHSRGNQDWDDKPVFTSGTGATIIYPGQTAPTYYSSQPGASPPPAPGTTPTATSPQTQPAPPTSYGSAPTTQVGPNGERSSSGPQPGGMPITMIGGAEQESKGHVSWKQDPVWMKYLTLPFALVAAPFKAMAGGEPEPGPEIPPTPPVTLGTPQSRTPTSGAAPAPPLDYESEMVERLERELDQRGDSFAPESASNGASRNGNRASATPQVRTTSIADELAALKQKPAENFSAPAPNPQPARTHSPSSTRPPTREKADGVVDRDQDGRIDQWIFRENGEIERVELDENGDGIADRMLHYDLDTNQIRLVEEDSDADGASDSWTEYENGKVARRRSDGNYDGNIDTWSFYRDGLITRHEQDTNGDGFRDRVGTYRDGKLIREDRDRDGDGTADAKTHYDASEKVSRLEEDNDRDGIPDVISYYEAGRLARRELLNVTDAPKTGRP